MSDRVFRSRRVVTPTGVRAAAIEVRDGVIVAVHGPDGAPPDLPVHDAHDAVILPGLVDTHVHVNEPGRTAWEGFDCATRAAAAGGVTTLVDMPLNSIPATVTRTALGTKRAAALGRCAVDVGFLGGVVPRQLAEITGLHDAGVLGFKCFLVDSGVEEFPPVGEAQLERAVAAVAATGAVLMAHCELPGPLATAATPLVTRRHAEYVATRPAEAETSAIALLLRLAERHHARVHVVHVSSAASLPLLRAARSRGLPVTAETCPHYLHFAAGDVPDGATEFKCAPPIRSAGDREALWGALADGTLDQIVSDHSPCPPELRQRAIGDFMAAWGGIASLQLGLGIAWTGMRARRLPVERLAEWCSAAPARLVGLAQRKGAIAAGLDADLVVWAPEEEHTVRAEDLLHRHKLTPYLGARLAGVVHSTWLRGERVYSRERGVEGMPGHLLYRETASV